MAFPNDGQKFLPGSTGNPTGRPKGKRNRSTIAREVLSMLRAIPDEMKEKLKQIYPDLPDDMTVEEVMTLAIVEKVISKGDSFSYQAIMDSAYGKPTNESEPEPEQTIDVSKYSIDELRTARNLIHKGRTETDTQ